MSAKHDEQKDFVLPLVDGPSLRKRAEEKAQAIKARDLGPLSPEESARLLHELQVHQIELEMQNEELRRAQEALEGSRARYFELYDLAPVGYFTLSERSMILEANFTSAAMLGIPKGALTKTSLTRYIFPDDQDIFYRHRKRLFETGEPQVFEIRVIRLDGGPFWVRVEAHVAQDGKSGAPACRAVMIDITETRRSRGELELRVQERTAELELRNRELQEFAFVASHDLSEPLRKVQTFGSLLMERSSDRLGEKEKDYISRMAGAADRMQELLDALLWYSRVGTKGQEFRSAKLNDVAKDAANDLEIQLRETGARVEIGPLPTVNGDPYQLRQLFQNLIANAVKYHRLDVKTIIKIYGEGDDGTGRIFVEDNGIGFDQKYLAKIFQPFQRLHGRKEYTGVGIGLAICRKIVERHGGTITAKSTPGKGSTFIVSLPVRQTGPAPK
jgi:PAS domain S-box-containing protein